MDNPNSIKTARIISSLFVPPSFTIIIFTVFAFTLEQSAVSRFVLVSTALVFGFILPVIMFAAFRKKGFIADIDAKVKEERTFPFAISIIFYTTGLLILIFYRIDIISIIYQVPQKIPLQIMSAFIPWAPASAAASPCRSFPDSICFQTFRL